MMENQVQTCSCEQVAFPFSVQRGVGSVANLSRLPYTYRKLSYFAPWHVTVTVIRNNKEVEMFVSITLNANEESQGAVAYHFLNFRPISLVQRIKGIIRVCLLKFLWYNVKKTQTTDSFPIAQWQIKRNDLGLKIIFRELVHFKQILQRHLVDVS